MLRRLFVGLLLGAVIGVAASAVLVAGLKVTVFDGMAGTFEAYAAALLVGVLAGLVAGKPIWASDAKVEAGLKAVFGALLAAGGMFALRRWAPLVSLPAPLGTGAPVPLGALPASLPALGAVLGALFELDNTDDGKAATPGSARPRVSAPAAARRVAGGRPAADGADEDVDAQRSRKASRAPRG